MGRLQYLKGCYYSSAFPHSLHNPSIPSSLSMSLLPALSHCSALSSCLPLVFHAGTSRAQRRQSAGFLARRSSSSSFCFHQWTTILHLCCVSKYLLAFLFLTAPTGVGLYFCVSLCLYLYKCVQIADLYTCRILLNSHTDVHRLLSPSVPCCPSQNVAFTPTPIPNRLFIMHLANSHKRNKAKEEEVIAVFSCSLPPPLASARVHALQSQRGKSPESKCT